MNRAIDREVEEVAVIAEVSSNAIDMVYDWAKSRSLLQIGSAGQGQAVSMQSSGDDKSRAATAELPPFIISTWPKIHSHSHDTSDPRCAWAEDSVEPSDTSVESAKGTAILDFFNSINGHRISKPIRHSRLQRALETVLNEKRITRTPWTPREQETVMTNQTRRGASIRRLHRQTFEFWSPKITP